MFYFYKLDIGLALVVISAQRVGTDSPQSGWRPTLEGGRNELWEEAAATHERGATPSGEAHMTKRHWKKSWNRHRTERLVLSCTSEESLLVRSLAAASGQTIQGYLMGLVLRAAARRRRSDMKNHKEVK